MKLGSRIVVYTGINFLTVPSPQISNSTFLAFQKEIITNGLEFVKAENPKNSIVLSRELPYPLIINISNLDAQVGQIMVISPGPKSTNEVFIQEVESVVSAFNSVWPYENRQLIKSDATIRALYETTSPHAFQELWEKRLGQSVESLSAFGRPILGGGLRFVLAPNKDETPTQIEIKVESYLLDTTKIFVETQFIWPAPQKPKEPFNVREHLCQIENYIDIEVSKFLSGGIGNAI